jgi:hypothetical protein
MKSGARPVVVCVDKFLVVACPYALLSSAKHHDRLRWSRHVAHIDARALLCPSAAARTVGAKAWYPSAVE